MLDMRHLTLSSCCVSSCLPLATLKGLARLLCCVVWSTLSCCPALQARQSSQMKWQIHRRRPSHSKLQVYMMRVAPYRPSAVLDGLTGMLCCDARSRCLICSSSPTSTVRQRPQTDQAIHPIKQMQLQTHKHGPIGSTEWACTSAMLCYKVMLSSRVIWVALAAVLCALVACKIL